MQTGSRWNWRSQPLGLVVCGGGGINPLSKIVCRKPSQKSLTKIQTWISSRLLVRWLTRGHASTAKRCSTQERSEFQHYFIRTSSRNTSTVQLSWRSWGIGVMTSWKLFIAMIKFGRGRPQGRSRPRRPASNKRLLPPRKLTVRSLL